MPPGWGASVLILRRPVGLALPAGISNVPETTGARARVPRPTSIGPVRLHDSASAPAMNSARNRPFSSWRRRAATPAFRGGSPPKGKGKGAESGEQSNRYTRLLLLPERPYHPEYCKVVGQARWFQSLPRDDPPDRGDKSQVSAAS